MIDSTNPRVMADNIRTLATMSGGTSVEANPEGAATDELEKLGIGDDIYSIPVYTPLNYSTTEQDTGRKWVNNEALYEKTFVVAHTFTSGSNNITLEENTAISTANIKNASILFDRASGATIKASALTDIQIVASGSDLALYVEVSGSTFGSGNVILTIQYTKSS